MKNALKSAIMTMVTGTPQLIDLRYFHDFLHIPPNSVSKHRRLLGNSENRWCTKRSWWFLTYSVAMQS